MQAGDMTMTTTPILRRPDRPELSTALKSAGFLVFEACEGGRDRERLREFWAALMLFDLPMPRLGGMEAFRRLRGAGDDTPEAIILTYDRIPQTNTVVRLGTIDVLARPLGPEAVRAAVEAVLRPVEGARPAPAGPRILVAVEPLMPELIRAKRSLDCREFDGAEQLLRRAIATDPDSAVAHYLMGVLHQRLGEHNAAYHSFKAALRADPQYEPALENLRRQGNRLGLDLRRSFSRAADRRGALDRLGDPNAKIGPTELTQLYDRSRRHLGLGPRDEPGPGPSNKRGR
jgi:DNA-binding response OmpR family regulator